jgi:hypothetical protein
MRSPRARTAGRADVRGATPETSTCRPCWRTFRRPLA